MHQGPFGLVGFSFGVPHTVAAARDRPLRADVAAAVGFRGYCDPRRTIHVMMTGQHEHNGDTIYLRPHTYGRWIMAANWVRGRWVTRADIDAGIATLADKHTGRKPRA